MSKSSFKKSKLGRMPGDLPLSILIKMLEKGQATISYGPATYALGKRQAKSLKNILRKKERARLKERLRKE